MARIWVTNGTPTIPAMVNPITAACDDGYVPDEAHLLSNPGIAEDVEQAKEIFKSVIDAYGGDAEISIHHLDDETDYPAIIQYYKSAIETAIANGDEVAVDVTPGRKYMSAIAFQAGFEYGADRVYYFHRIGGDYRDMFYPEIPRTGADLIDFTGVI